MSQPTANCPPQSGENPSGLYPGQKVADGRFMLKTLLGRGGMAEVWLAIDENLAERPALKFLTGLKDDPEAVEDLRRETQKCRRLSHPNIVRIHDFHFFPGEPAFISMESVDGVTLDAARRQQSSRVLSWEYLQPLVQQLCGALEYAHGEHLIHRDLKPANLLVDGKGRLKLGDFGIAAQASERRTQGVKRHARSGTPPYMSPQQIRGETAQVTDDIYALGATLYELLTGKPPFYLGDIVHQALHVAPRTLEDRLADFDIQNSIPPDVQTMIMACLSKEAAQRPQSAAAVAKWIAGEGGPSVGNESTGQMADSAARRAVMSSTGVEEFAAEPASKSVAPKSDGRPTGVIHQGSTSRKWFVLAGVVVVIGLVAILAITLSARKQGDRSTATTGNPYKEITHRSVPLAEIATVGTKFPALVPLKLYWNSDNQAALAAASPAGESQAIAGGYRLLGVQGRIFATQQPDTVPLKLFYDEKRKDYMLVASPQARIDAETARYSLVGIEGYVYDTPHPGTIPLKLFWSGKLLHNLSVAGQEAEEFAKSVGYGFVRTEGCILPANESAPTLPWPTSSSIDLGHGVKMELVLIRPGSFMMGSNTDQSEAKPAHKVTLTKPFYLGKFEVTQEQWQAVMENNPSRFKGPKLPVEQVSWNDCQSFLTKLRQKTGKKFTLPTEAQWEYACRAGTTTRYSFGDRDASLGEHAWFSVNSGSTTHPVGTKKPNAWGLYDMHGNVWEWCADLHGSYPSGDATDPKGASSGRTRVLRGGAWGNGDPGDFLASNRINYEPGGRDGYDGFRCAIGIVGEASR